MKRAGRSSCFALAAALAAFGACAQGKAPRVVGYLTVSEEGARERCLRDFVVALEKLGWRNEADYRIVLAHAPRDESRLDEQARELLHARPDLLVTRGVNLVSALRRATAKVPIVVLGAGAMQPTGLIESLHRPGGNVTGISLGEHHGSKSLEVLRQLMPGARRIGLLTNRNNPAHSRTDLAQTAARLGLTLVQADFGSLDDLEPAWRRLAAANLQAVFIAPDVGAYAEAHARLALAHRLPAMWYHARFVRSGGAFAYGHRANTCEMGARYADQILRGRSPRELPVEEVEDTGLSVNLRTLRRLGVDAAPALARAVEVIE